MLITEIVPRDPPFQFSLGQRAVTKVQYYFNARTISFDALYDFDVAKFCPLNTKQSGPYSKVSATQNPKIQYQIHCSNEQLLLMWLKIFLKFNVERVLSQ